MENFVAVALFDLAFLVPPLTVLAGIVMLALPRRSKKVPAPQVTVRAA